MISYGHNIHINLRITGAEGGEGQGGGCRREKQMRWEKFAGDDDFQEQMIICLAKY